MARWSEGGWKSSWLQRVYNREEWKKLLRMARNRRILHMPMEWMNGIKALYPLDMHISGQILAEGALSLWNHVSHWTGGKGQHKTRKWQRTLACQGSHCSNPRSTQWFYKAPHVTGACGGVVVKAPCCKPAGRRFDSRWCHWNFSVT